MFGHHQHASETTFKWRPPASSTKKKRCQGWTPFDKIFWIPSRSDSGNINASSEGFDKSAWPDNAILHQNNQITFFHEKDLKFP